VIDEDTCEIGNGPVNFDVKLARQWGMSERVILNTWNKIAALVDRASSAAVRAHPERWRRDQGDALVYVGPTPDQPAFTRAEKKRMGVTPLRRGGRRLV
jgi:hypothetical protein